jgi:hypothetical protein
MSKTKIYKLYEALSVIKEIDRFKDCDMIGTIYRETVPEHYKLTESMIIHNYNVEVYNADEVYLILIRHLGIFQCM